MSDVEDMVEYQRVVEDVVPWPQRVWDDGGGDDPQVPLFKAAEEFAGWQDFLMEVQRAGFALVDAYAAGAPAADRVKIVTDLFESHSTKGLFMLYQVLAILTMRKVVRKKERISAVEIARRLGMETWNPPLSEQQRWETCMFLIYVAIDEDQEIRRTFAQQALQREWGMLHALARAAVAARGYKRPG